MRFRLWLPVSQIIATLLVIWAPWAPNAHKIDLFLMDGREIKAWSLIPGPKAAEWELGMNLPTIIVVSPVESAIRKADFPDYRWEFVGCAVVGILCWYMIGRLVEDFIQWRNFSRLPAIRRSDLSFALIAAPSTLLSALTFTYSRTGSAVLPIWGALWLAASFAALGFRVLQLVKRHLDRRIH